MLRLNYFKIFFIATYLREIFNIQLIIFFPFYVLNFIQLNLFLHQSLFCDEFIA